MDFFQQEIFKPDACLDWDFTDELYDVEIFKPGQQHPKTDTVFQHRKIIFENLVNGLPEEIWDKGLAEFGVNIKIDRVIFKTIAIANDCHFVAQLNQSFFQGIVKPAVFPDE
jgi:hypothetical protein